MNLLFFFIILMCFSMVRSKRDNAWHRRHQCILADTFCLVLHQSAFKLVFNSNMTKPSLTAEKKWSSLSWPECFTSWNHVTFIATSAEVSFEDQILAILISAMTFPHTPAITPSTFLPSPCENSSKGRLYTGQVLCDLSHSSLFPIHHRAFEPQHNLLPPCRFRPCWQYKSW